MAVIFFRVLAPTLSQGLQPVLFLASFVLFMVPGLVLARLFTSRHLPATVRVPVAFALSTGVYGLVGVGALVLHVDLGVYLLACGALLGGFLILAVLDVRYGWSGGRAVRGYGGSPLDRLLWVPLILLAGALAYTARERVPAPEEDFWTYLGYVRQFLNTDSLGTYLPGYGTEVQGFSRLSVNGWLLVQAALSRVSGIDPVVLVSGYLGPALVGITLLAVYALALVLVGSRPAALLTGSAAAVFFLTHIDFTLLPPGSELVGRVTEDKFAARFIFLPVALLLVTLFLRARGRRYLWLFFFVCLTVAAVHPLGLVFIGIPVAGLLPLHLLSNLRDKTAWIRAGGLGAVLLGLVGVPAGYLLLTGSRLLSKLDSTSEARVEYLVSVWQASGRLLPLGDGGYIMHPDLVLEPAILASYILGVPFLAWRLKKDVAAQVLLGTLLVVPVLLYVPPLTTAIAGVVGPWMLFRLAWPLPLAAVLTLGWAGWTAIRYTAGRLGGPAAGRLLMPLMAVVLIGALISISLPRSLQGIRAAANTGETAESEATCKDPAFRWMSENLPTRDSSRKFLAPSPESGCIPAYVAPAGVFSQRGQVPQDGAPEEGGDSESFTARQAQSLKTFLEARAPDDNMVKMLQAQKIDYILLPQGSELNPTLGSLPGVTTLDNPGNRYQLYRVDRDTLEPSPVTQAALYLNNGRWLAAAQAYQQALSGAGSPEEEVGTLAGLAAAYSELNRPAQAAATYQSALDTAPQDLQPPLFSLAADAYTAAGDFTAAQSTLREAAERFPENAALRQRLASALLFEKPAEAVAEQEAVVETYPEVASYHARLGSVISLAAQANASAANASTASADQEAGDAQRQAERRAEEQAGEQYEKARELEPLSAELEAEIATYHSSAGDFEAAASSYERSVELEPDNAYYRLKLGEVYYTLATRSGGEGDDSDSSSDGSGDSSNEDSEGYYGKAERELRRSVELELLPWQEAGLRAEGWVALGDLYGSRGREGEAREAYEAALEADPDSSLAQAKLEELR